MKKSGASQATGFTLIEIMIVVALIAILSAIAMPAYNNYINRGHLKTAQADLIALSLNLENFYQKRLAYPATANTDSNTTGKVKGLFPGWSPAAGEKFDYATQNGGSGTAATTGYTVTATGKVGGALADCTLSLDQTGDKQLTNSCPYGKGGWL